MEPAASERLRDQHEEEGAAGEQQALRPLRRDERHVGEDDARPAQEGQQFFHRLTRGVRIKETHIRYRYPFYRQSCGSGSVRIQIF